MLPVSFVLLLSKFSKRKSGESCFIKEFSWLYGYHPDLKAGDKVLLKKGEIFTGELHIKGTGTPEKQIIIDAYGDKGNNPCIVGFSLKELCRRLLSQAIGFY